ncbi:MAG: T9SS type A sorting domain-containing protein [Bacteroidetes bacterium]|nr:T9SS type A sorting domain-containing protein [Bacteroidota bacterium]
MIKFSTRCMLLAALLGLPCTVTAQTPVVSISGTRCPGHTHTCYSSINPAKITWKKGTTVLQTDSAFWQTSAFTAVGVTDTAGTTGAYLHGPDAVFVDKHGNIYIADKLNARIQKRTDSLTITVAGTGTAGSTAKQLNNPAGIFVDTAGNLYIADAGNNRIQKWKAGDTVGTTVAGSSSGTSGSSASLLNNPVAVFRDATGNLYIADAGNNRIQKWASGATSGSTIAGSSSGTAGSTAALFNNPRGLFVDASANIYVADAGNNRIQKWTSGASSGSTVAGSSSGTSGTSASLLNAPSAVSVDGRGYIYITDAGNNRIQLWPSGASGGITIGGSATGSSGSSAALLDAPQGIALDTRNNVYVADYNNQRIQKFTDTIRNTFTPVDTGIYTATVTTFSNSSTAANDTITLTVTPLFSIGSPSSVKIPRVMVAICPGMKSISFFSNPPVNGGDNPSFQWKVNGINVATTDLLTPFIDTDFHRGDSVSCVMTSSLGCASPSIVTSGNSLQIDTLHAYTPSVTIKDNGYPYLCTYTLDTFTAIVSGYANTPTFIWQVNGDTVGANSNKFHTYGALLNTGDTVKCTIISLDGCAIPRDTTSNKIGITVVPSHPSIDANITALVGNTLCEKVNVAVFMVRATRYTIPPTYQWIRNGKNIVGAIKDTVMLLPDSISNGDRIACIVTSQDVCPMSPYVYTNNDTLHLLPPATPSVTITDSPNVIPIPGTTVTFTAHPVNGGKHPTYVWYKNTHKIPGIDTNVYVTNDVAVGDIIHCVMFSDAQCLSAVSGTSNSLTMRSKTAVAQVGNLAGTLTLYPNPNQGNFMLHAALNESHTGPASFQITNVIGQQVYNGTVYIQAGILNNEFFIPGLSPGMYTLHLITNDGGTAAIRFVVQK